MLPYARAVVPVRLRGILARIAPFSAARDMKLHADLVAQKLRQLFEVKKRAIEQGDEAIAQQIGGGKDLMSIFGKAYKQSRKAYRCSNAAYSESERRCLGKREPRRRRAERADGVSRTARCRPS